MENKWFTLKELVDSEIICERGARDLFREMWGTEMAEMYWYRYVNPYISGAGKFLWGNKKDFKDNRYECPFYLDLTQYRIMINSIAI